MTNQLIDKCTSGKVAIETSSIGLENLCFRPLSPKETIVRKCAIPDVFKDRIEYEEKWRSAVHEELNIKLAILARSFYACLENHAKQHKGRVSGDKVPFGLLENALKKRNVLFHYSCTFTITNHKNLKFARNGRTGVGNSDNQAKKKRRFFLTIDRVGNKNAYRYGTLIEALFVNKQNLIAGNACLPGSTTCGLLAIH